MRYSHLIPWELTDQQITGLTIWGEGRGASREQQMVIGNVISNRWELKIRGMAYRKAESIGDICLWPRQFSCWSSTDPNFKAIGRAVALDLSPYEGRILKQCNHIGIGVLLDLWEDEVHGADHYHHYPLGHPDWPRWAKSESEVMQRGKAYLYRLFR